MLSRPSALADYPGKGDVYSHSSVGQHLQSCRIAIASLHYTCTKVLTQHTGTQLQHISAHSRQAGTQPQPTSAHSRQAHNPNIHLHTQRQAHNPIIHLHTQRQAHNPVLHLHTQDRHTAPSYICILRTGAHTCLESSLRHYTMKTHCGCKFKF